jgi:hypothetical protein
MTVSHSIPRVLLALLLVAAALWVAADREQINVTALNAWVDQLVREPAKFTGRVELSPVLKAMGIRPEVGMRAIRFSLGRYTAIEEIDAVVDRLTDVLAAGSHLGAKPPGLVEGRDRCSL